MLLHPNPVKGILHIELPGVASPPGTTGVIRLLDITGKVLREENIGGGSIDWDVHGYTPGIYLVNVILHNRIMSTQSIVIAR